MKKYLLILTLVLTAGGNIFAQSANLGFRNDINGGLFVVNYLRGSENDSTGVNDVNGDVRFYNFNFRFGGSLIGAKIFDEDSRFFVGDYTQIGLGFGTGKNNDATDTYAGTTFNLLLGCHFGVVGAYAISDELSAGLKVILIGGDLYFDFDENPLFVNGLTFHPTVQYSNFLVSAGFGGRTVKGYPYKTIDVEARYNFDTDQETSAYVGLRFQSNKYSLSQNGYREYQSITSFGVMGGFFF